MRLYAKDATIDNRATGDDGLKCIGILINGIPFTLCACDYPTIVKSEIWAGQTGASAAVAICESFGDA